MFFDIAGYIPLLVIELLLDVSYAVDKVMTIGFGTRPTLRLGFSFWPNHPVMRVLMLHYIMVVFKTLIFNPGRVLQPPITRCPDICWGSESYVLNTGNSISLLCMSYQITFLAELMTA
mgnify:CR=1 FL=1